MRSLPLRLAPIDDESLPGYIARYSFTFGIAPGDVSGALGLAGEQRLDHFRLSARQAEGAAAASGLAPEAIRAMTLERYAGSAFALANAGESTPTPRSVLSQEVSLLSSRACPACLREQGAWLLRWQLGWSLICTHHRVLLISSCPACGGRLGPPRRARWRSDEQGELRDPCACWADAEDRLCRADPRAARAASVGRDRELVAAQRHLDAVLAGELSPRIAGEEVAAPSYLHDLHALGLLLRGYPEFAAARPPALRRQATRQPRARGRLLLNPAALAAVLPEAMRLADLPDEDALVEGLREVLERRHLADAGTLPKHRELHAPSERLTGLLRHAAQTAGFAHISTRMGFDPRAHRRPADLDPRLEARHVPQLFWAGDYERSLEQLFDFDDFSPWFARRFCSTLLARMLAPLDWRGAVRYLELPQNYRHGGYQVTQAKLRRHGRFEELVAQIKAAANEHAARGPLVDYRLRRAQLSDWEGIDPECWLYLQPVRRPERWRVDPPKRRAHASIWLWCELTSGHEQAAPIALPSHPKRALHDHTIFKRQLLAPLRERLLILGELLLATPGEARSSLATQLAVALLQRGDIEPDFHFDRPDPLIARRALAHVGAHTGVDIPTLTAPPIGSRAPAAVTHARLLAATLLRQTTLASWSGIAGVLSGYPHRLSDNSVAYRAARDRDPALAAELEALVQRVRDWRAPVAAVPDLPHHGRMHAVAEAIKGRAEELFPGEDPATSLRASALACRGHTDLTWPEVAAVHRIPAYAAFFQKTVSERRRGDPDFDRRYRDLLAYARELRCSAGYANANLCRGLINQSWRQIHGDDNYASKRQAA